VPVVGRRGKSTANKMKKLRCCNSSEHRNCQQIQNNGQQYMAESETSTQQCGKNQKFLCAESILFLQGKTKNKRR